MSEIKVIKDQISQRELKLLAELTFGDFVKAVVDVKKEVVAFGGEMHADMEAVLISQGSEGKNLWGINLYPQKTGDEWLQFNSMINIKPSLNNRSRGVENPETQEKIRKIIDKLVV